MRHLQTDPIRIPIVYYHSVGPKKPAWRRNHLTLELKYFKDQLEYISRNHHVISLKKFHEIRNGLSSPEKNALVITFDDGFLDNWIWAFPLLKKYGLKATIFVSPEFVDAKKVVRPNLNDVEEGRTSLGTITDWGYLSWEEMRLMEASGLIDVQAHAMTHTRYFVSERLIDLHHPGADIIYPAGNLFPERKPYSIGDADFERLLPYGFPLFEDRSAIVARKVMISPAFIDECIDRLKGYDFGKFVFADAFALVKPIYQSFSASGKLVVARETEEGYRKRLEYEIAGAKISIESNLHKKVEFLCWPFGEYNEIAQGIAKDAGYLATTSGSKQKTPAAADRIPQRIGLYHSRNSRLLSILKTRYKINGSQGRFPFKQINSIYTRIKYGCKNARYR